MFNRINSSSAPDAARNERVAEGHDGQVQGRGACAHCPHRCPAAAVLLGGQNGSKSWGKVEYT